MIQPKARNKLREIEENISELLFTSYRNGIRRYKYKSVIIEYKPDFIEDDFDMWLRFGNHVIKLRKDSFTYLNTYTDSRRCIYDETRILDTIYNLPDLRKIQCTEEGYFQQSTLYDFRYLTQQDLSALQTILNKVSQQTWTIK